MLAPAALTAAFRKLHQFTVFCVNTAVQYGLAGYMNKYLECDFDNGGDLSPWQYELAISLQFLRRISRLREFV